MSKKYRTTRAEADEMVAALLRQWRTNVDEVSRRCTPFTQVVTFMQTLDATLLVCQDAWLHKKGVAIRIMTQEPIPFGEFDEDDEAYGRDD